MFIADWMMARRDSTLRGRPTLGRVTLLFSVLSVLVIGPSNEMNF
jgi:hypothetical protein